MLKVKSAIMHKIQLYKVKMGSRSFNGQSTQSGESDFMCSYWISLLKRSIQWKCHWQKVGDIHFAMLVFACTGALLH